MPTPAFRPDPASDPLRAPFREVRRALFRLHKSLVDAERVAFERQHGTTSSGQFLQHLIHDDFFAWLRPFSRLIVEMDEALAPREPIEPPLLADFLERTRALVEPDDEGKRYAEVCRHDPDVLLRHLELEQRIRAAGEV